jgi:outer membrane murein-binding lipoprotein Lpp
MANSMLLLLLATGITSLSLGFALAYQWKSRKIKQLSTTLSQLKSSFSSLENEQNKMAVFIHSLQKQKEQSFANNLQLNEINKSLQFNIQQLESDRQGIINAFNTYKSQTVARIKNELDQTKNSNEALREKYQELLDLQEEKYAMVIDLAQRRAIVSDKTSANK